MESIFGDTIKAIEQSIEKQKLIYDSLLSKAKTEEEKQSLKKLLEISDGINTALRNKDIEALNNFLNEIKNADNFIKQ